MMELDDRFEVTSCRIISEPTGVYVDKVVVETDGKSTSLIRIRDVEIEEHPGLVVLALTEPAALQLMTLLQREIYR